MEVQTEIIRDSKVYGKRSQLRSQEPQMSQILQWNEGKDNFYDYKKNKSVLKFMSDYGRYKNLINKTKSNFITEQQECYKKFNYLNKEESLKKFPEHFQEDKPLTDVEKQQQMQFKYQDMSEEELKQYLKENEIIRTGNQTKGIQRMHQIEHTQPQVNDTIKIQNILNNHHMAQSGYYNKQQQHDNQNKQNVIQDTVQTQSQIIDQQTQQNIDEQTQQNIKKQEVQNQQINKENSVKKKRKKKNQKQKRIEDRIKKFKQQSRWLANSAFQTYFGKPAFENYGRKNVNPAWGGPIYGNYLKTHNINPQRGSNKPKYDQVYTSSQLATAKINYKKNHVSKAPKEEYRMSDKQIENLKQRNQLTIKETQVKKLGQLDTIDLKKTQAFKSPKMKRHKSVGRKYLTLKNIKKQKEKPQSTQRQIDKIVDKSIKGFEIKEHYELNPKNYINVNPNFLKQIPYAGKQSSTKNLFNMSNNSENLTKSWTLKDQFKFIKKVNNRIYGDIELYQHKKNKNYIIIKEQRTNKLQELKAQEKGIKLRMQLNHPNFINLLDYAIHVDKGLCSTSYVIQGIYEFDANNLLSIQKIRRKSNKKFSQRDLTFIAVHILQILDSLHDLSYSHGNINLDSISFSKSRQKYYLHDRFHTSSIDQQKVNLIEKKSIYVSPELYYAVRRNDSNIEINTQQNDLFALGLVLLELSLDHSIQILYKSNGEFDRKKLNYFFSQFDQKYRQENPYLSMILFNLLEVVPSKRNDADFILKKLDRDLFNNRGSIDFKSIEALTNTLIMQRKTYLGQQITSQRNFRKVKQIQQKDDKQKVVQIDLGVPTQSVVRSQSVNKQLQSHWLPSTQNSKRQISVQKQIQKNPSQTYVRNSNYLNIPTNNNGQMLQTQYYTDNRNSSYSNYQQDQRSSSFNYSQQVNPQNQRIKVSTSPQQNVYRQSQQQSNFQQQRSRVSLSPQQSQNRQQQGIRVSTSPQQSQNRQQGIRVSTSPQQQITKQTETKIIKKQHISFQQQPRHQNTMFINYNDQNNQQNKQQDVQQTQHTQPPQFSNIKTNNVKNQPIQKDQQSPIIQDTQKNISQIPKVSETILIKTMQSNNKSEKMIPLYGSSQLEIKNQQKNQQENQQENQEETPKYIELSRPVYKITEDGKLQESEQKQIVEATGLDDDQIMSILQDPKEGSFRKQLLNKIKLFKILSKVIIIQNILQTLRNVLQSILQMLLIQQTNYLKNYALKTQILIFKILLQIHFNQRAYSQQHTFNEIHFY